MKNIIITGASKKTGIGYNTVKQLLEDGCHVIATVRDLENNDLVRDGFDQNANLSIKQLDLTDEASIASFAKSCLQEFKVIDVLINNAANVYGGPVEAAFLEDVEITFQTKVFGPIALIQNFLPHWRERRQGFVINLSSIYCTSQKTAPGIGVYIAALSAAERIYDSLAIELKPWNIQVVNFQPGPVETKLSIIDRSRFTDDNPYEGYSEQSYRYYDDNPGWQSVEEVGCVLAGIALKETPHHCYQSNEATQNFVRQYRDDPTGDRYIDQMLLHFDSVADEYNDGWKIKKSI